MHAVDRTLSIGHRANELMRAYSVGAEPRSYEVWYNYVAAVKPALNAAVKIRIQDSGRLTAGDIDELHAAHLSDNRLAAAAETTSSGLLIEMGQVLSLVSAALGSTAEYRKSLQAFDTDVGGASDGRHVRDAVAALLDATREVAANNRKLERRLREAQSEIGGLQVALDAIRVETLTDPLTGLANRRHFEGALATELVGARASGDPLMLIAIDIDDFKRFNDQFGHLTGDQVLRLVSTAIRESVPRTATLARLGGEEFAVLLRDTTRELAEACAERIRDCVVRRELLKRSTGESLGRVTVSLGIADLRCSDEAGTFMERADACLYRAKRSGKNCTVTEWSEAFVDAAAAA